MRSTPLAMASAALAVAVAVSLARAREGESLDVVLARALAAAGIRVPERPRAEPPQLVALGRALFFDPILSGNRDVACATCHSPAHGTTDGRALPRSGDALAHDLPETTARLGPRRVPALWNAGSPEVESFFWDARVARTAAGELESEEPRVRDLAPVLGGVLAAQALFPVTSIPEMRGEPGTNELANGYDAEEVWRGIAARLVGTRDGASGGCAGYRTLFRAAFPALRSFDDVRFAHAARAIAAFERSSFTALDSPLDRWLAGRRDALPEAAKRGALLFCGRAGCARCHGGPLLSDFGVHALAVPQVGPGKPSPGEDRGRAIITKRLEDEYRFRTPPLRNTALAGHWMHDGCYASLESAVRHHLDAARSYLELDAASLSPEVAGSLDRDGVRGAQRLGQLDPLLRAKVALQTSEVRDLLAFLDALTDTRAVASLAGLAPERVPSGLAAGGTRAR